MISKRTWITFLSFAILGACLWVTFAYPQLSFIQLKIDRPAALQKAEHFLTTQMKVNPRELAHFRHASIFVSLDNVDQYLQKALGINGEMAFFKAHQFQIFFWGVRYFKENNKEEYRLSIDAATGRIVDYTHVIDDSAKRPNQSQDEAWQRAVDFLKTQIAFDLSGYDIYSNNTQQFDHRTNYYFSWKKKGVEIPWQDEEKSGTAKLLVGATVSGHEILNFYSNRLEIPNEYYRYMDQYRNVGQNLTLFFRIVFYILLTTAIFHVVVRRNNLVLHTVKNFAVLLTAFVFLLFILDYFNEFQSVLYNYQNSIPLNSYLMRSIVSTFLNDFIAVLTILMPLLAGESLYYELYGQGQRRWGGFLYYLRTSFWSRNVAAAITLGYLSAIIMIGIQSLAFKIGQDYLGVWVQNSWMTQLSASYWPVLGAFVLGFTASTSEEICFRLFGITLAKKFLRSTVFACLIASLIWGYGHSHYPVYPMWFRGIEVTCMGLFLSFVFLRYGMIATITAHYLFDVFWSCSAYLLNQATLNLTLSAFAMLALPLLIAIIAWIRNQTKNEEPLKWRLNFHQQFNLQILKYYLSHHPELRSRSKEELIKEISSHGWDLAVVQIAVNEIFL